MRILLYALALSLLLLSVAAHKSNKHSRIPDKSSSRSRHHSPTAFSASSHSVKTHTNSKLLKRDSGHVVAIASEGEVGHRPILTLRD